MGSYTSKEDKKVDEGYSYTNGLYSNVVQDYDKKIVRKLIMSRKLAPFYKGKDEVDTFSENIPESTNKSSSSSPPSPPQLKDRQIKSNQSILYADTVECPICFLCYPSNINYSKCCDQPICTECFVQIKRSDPLLPPSCPFCVQPNFGIIYHPPSPINHSHQRYSMLLSVTTPCYPAITKNDITRSTSGNDLPLPSPNGKSSKHPTLKQSKSHIRRSLVKQKPSLVVLVDHIRPPLDAPSSTIAGATIASAESSLPIRRYYATDTTMETPSFEDWMVMEAVRRSLQDQQNSQDTSSSSNATTSFIPQRTPNTPITSEDSSILC